MIRSQRRGHRSAQLRAAATGRWGVRLATRIPVARQAPPSVRVMKLDPTALEPLNPAEVRYRLAFYILAIFTLDIA